MVDCNGNYDWTFICWCRILDAIQVERKIKSKIYKVISFLRVHIDRFKFVESWNVSTWEKDSFQKDYVQEENP
jgi:hypothetical protein